MINIILMEDFMENIKDIEGRMQKSVDNLKEEYVTIRAGRANPAERSLAKVLWRSRRLCGYLFPEVLLH